MAERDVERSDGEPAVLLPHQLPGDGTTVLGDALRERFPDADVRAATSEDETFAHAPDAEVLVVYLIPDGLLEAMDRLRWVQTVSAGVDHLDIDRFREAGWTLTNAAGLQAQSVAEQTLGYLLYFERNLGRYTRQQREAEWSRTVGGELADRTVAVVGVGGIGSRVATFCDVIGASTVGVTRDPTTGAEAVEECYAPDRLHEVLSRADYAVVACPLTDATEGLFDAAAFDAMPDDAVLVNVARGEIVDERGLVDALEAERIGGAALDTFETEPLPSDSPLWGFENVLLTPHVAGTTPNYWDRSVDLVAENYERYLAGDDLLNRIV